MQKDVQERITIDKTVTINLNQKTINGQQAGSVITITGGNVTIQNGTITGGYVENANGGGIFVQMNCTATIPKATITYNH